MNINTSTYAKGYSHITINSNSNTPTCARAKSCSHTTFTTTITTNPPRQPNAKTKATMCKGKNTGATAHPWKGDERTAAQTHSGLHPRPKER